MKSYEVLFILTPVLAENQMKDTVKRIKDLFVSNGANVTHEENWGLRKLAYPINHKKTGFYSLFEFDAPADKISKIETELRREEAILRFLTTVLDKYALAYNEKRRTGSFNKDKEEKVTVAAS